MWMPLISTTGMRASGSWRNARHLPARVRVAATMGLHRRRPVPDPRRLQFDRHARRPRRLRTDHREPPSRATSCAAASSATARSRSATSWRPRSITLVTATTARSASATGRGGDYVTSPGGPSGLRRDGGEADRRDLEPYVVSRRVRRRRAGRRATACSRATSCAGPERTTPTSRTRCGIVIVEPDAAHAAAASCDAQ